MSEPLLSVLDVDGKLVGDPPELPNELLLRMHETMVRNRKLDERAMLLQRQGRIGFYVPSFGEEACSAGTASALDDEDWIAPSYRQPGIALYRGIPAERMLDNCWGNSGDTAKGRQMPVHYSFKDAKLISISSPIGTQVVHGAGVAMAMKRRGDGHVCMTFFGDGATSSNDFHSGVNFAAVDKAPCVFICINNQWAISCDISKQTASATISQKAEAYGIPGLRVDGNDVLAVYRASKEACERARAGEGPTLLELLSFRMGPHSSSDDPSRYRPTELEEEWRRKDPIRRFETWLQGKEILTAEQCEAVHKKAEEEMAAAARASEKREAPSLSSLFEDVYATMPAALDEQRRRLLAEGSSHEADPNAAFPL